MNIVITGTSRGVGADLAQHYIEAGHQVWALTRPACDIRDLAAVRLNLQSFVKGWGDIDLVINNAGISKLRYALLLSPDDAREMVETNLLGTWNVCREAARLMVPRKHGAIVNIGSIHGRQAPAGTSIYAATKAGIEAMTAALAAELAPSGVTVNCLALSPYDTASMRATGSEDAIHRAIASQAVARLATVTDVANAIDFFASPASGMVTGQTVYLGGVR